MSVAQEICELIDNLPVTGEAVALRVMDQDYRASQWENAVNYLGTPITVMDEFGYIYPAVVVNERTVSPTLARRGGTHYAQRIDIWIYTPRGMIGTTQIRAMMNEVIALHEASIPSGPMMMLATVDGPLDDEKNLMTRVSFDLTFIPGESI